MGKHIPCGHWHKPVSWAPTVVPPSSSTEVETFIEILSSGNSFPSQQYGSVDHFGEDGPLFDVTFKSTYRPFNTADYDGSLTCTFEIVCANVSEINTCYAYLVDETDSIVATIAVPPNTRGPYNEYSDGEDTEGWRACDYWLYSVEFSVSGDHSYALRSYIPNLGNMVEWDAWTAVLKIAHARIRVHQTGCTKSVVHIPLMVLSNWCQMDWMEVPTYGEHCMSIGWETGGPELWSTAYADCESGDYSDDCRQIWQFNSAELAPVSEVVFDAGVSYIPTGPRYYNYVTLFGTPTLSAIGAELRWCTSGLLGQRNLSGTFGDSVVTDAGGNQFNLISGSYVYWRLSVEGGSWQQKLYLDSATIEALAGKYVFFCVKQQVYGGDSLPPPLNTYSYVKGISIPEARSIDEAWVLYQAIYNETREQYEIVCTFEYTLLPAACAECWLMLYDITADSYVAGSELHWEGSEKWSRQTVTLSSSVLINGHQYKVRWRTEDLGDITYPNVTDVNLWIKVTDMTAFTSWLRVAKGCMSEWRFPGVYADWQNDSLGNASYYLDLSCRALPWIPETAKVSFEGSFAEPIPDWGGSDPQHCSIVNTGVNLHGVGSGITGEIASSRLSVIQDDENGFAIYRRSDSITITGDEWYIANLPIDPWGNAWTISGFIVIQYVGG